jgi:hypothetical protein
MRSRIAAIRYPIASAIVAVIAMVTAVDALGSTSTPLFSPTSSTAVLTQSTAETVYTFFEANETVRLDAIGVAGTPIGFVFEQSDFRFQLFQTASDWSTPNGNDDRLFYEQHFFIDQGTTIYWRPVTSVVLTAGTQYFLSFQISNVSWLMPTYFNDDRAAPFVTEDGLFTIHGSCAVGVGPCVARTPALYLSTSPANAAPTISIASPSEGELVPISASVQVRASIGDPDASDTLSCTIDFGDLTAEDAPCDRVNGLIASPHEYGEAGVYEIWATATDGEEFAYDSTLVVVYDPSAGFVTGGGWIDSPAGAYLADPTVEGRASFGFVSKYRKGAQAPQGNTQFVFRSGDLNFHSANYDWLVVAGSKAQFKGVGSINGAGVYGFLISVVDSAVSSRHGDTDRFRIKIWDQSDAVVYDNVAEQELGEGSIVIHGGKK